MLTLPRPLHDHMLAHAIDGLPLEVCGILAGQGTRVQALYRITNSDASSTHFSMNLAEQYKTIKELRRSGLTMLAIYHSHPLSSALPSREDIRWAQNSDLFYLIISLMSVRNPVLRAFRIHAGQAQQAALRIL